MIPKEKAKELVSKFTFYQLPEDKGGGISFDNSKQCALICIDEIIENGFNTQVFYNYWDAVKAEIENL
jgi:hypothetical protein